MFAVKPPCSIGDAVKDIETPALVICLTTLESNLKKMAETMCEYPNVVLRPHSKTHKCPILARLQIKSGAVGVCCQTITEAEAMFAGGVEDILLSNQVFGKKKLLRLASLAKQAHLAVCVDSETNIEDLSIAANELGVNLELVIEVNVGSHRCGVEPGDNVAKLGKKIQSLPNVTFKGLHCYNGMNQHEREAAQRKKNAEDTIEKVKKALQVLKDNGIECNYVTGGGTGTFHHEASSGVYTEIQPLCSYVFMDADYRKNLDINWQFISEFEQSLFVLATVQSVSTGPVERAVIDAGMKAVSHDSGPPVIRGYETLTYKNGGDEHGVALPSGGLKVGDQVWLIPGHCDPTVNMHEWIVGVRNGKVESIWPVTGRGPGI